MRWEPPARGPWRRKEAVFWSLALQCQIDGGCGRAAFHHQGNARAGHDPALQRLKIAQRSYGLAIDLGDDVAGLEAGLLEARPPGDRKSNSLNSSHQCASRMPPSALQKTK